MFLYGIFRLFFDIWDSWLHILIEKITEMVERWEENSYRHHLGQCSHLEQVAQDVVWLSFDYHQRWPPWPTCSSLQLTINIFFPLGLSGIRCILIFAHCLLYLFLVISEKNLAWPFLLPSMLMSLLYRGPRSGQITGDVSHQCWVKGKSHLPWLLPKLLPMQLRLLFVSSAARTHN